MAGFEPAISGVLAPAPKRDKTGQDETPLYISLSKLHTFLTLVVAIKKEDII